MQSIFNFFVIAFQEASRLLDLSYEAFNILIYCLLVPLSWALLVWGRTRRYEAPVFLHAAAIPVFWVLRVRLFDVCIEFYNAQVTALDWWGRLTDWGYVGVSVFIGVLVPVLIYGLLVFLPKRFVFPYYLFLMVVSWGYYAWVWVNF